MTELDQADFRRAAELCLDLIQSDYGERLDWSLDSLTVLDDVCGALTAQGALGGERLDLWTNLTGSYTGEVIIRAHGGTWMVDERAGGACGVRTIGVTAFPFATAYRILTGEEGKSLASLARSLPFIAAQRGPEGSQG